MFFLHSRFHKQCILLAWEQARSTTKPSEVISTLVHSKLDDTNPESTAGLLPGKPVPLLCTAYGALVALKKHHIARVDFRKIIIRNDNKNIHAFIGNLMNCSLNEAISQGARSEYHVASKTKSLSNFVIFALVQVEWGVYNTRSE